MQPLSAEVPLFDYAQPGNHFRGSCGTINSGHIRWTVHTCSDWILMKMNNNKNKRTIEYLTGGVSWVPHDFISIRVLWVNFKMMTFVNFFYFFPSFFLNFLYDLFSTFNSIQFLLMEVSKQFYVLVLVLVKPQITPTRVPNRFHNHI